MEEKLDSGLGHSVVGGQEITTQNGQPDSWTLFREGFVQPLFALQKHMPEITVGRSTDCTLSCPGRLNRKSTFFKITELNSVVILFYFKLYFLFIFQLPTYHGSISNSFELILEGRFTGALKISAPVWEPTSMGIGFQIKSP